MYIAVLESEWFEDEIIGKVQRFNLLNYTYSNEMTQVTLPLAHKVDGVRQVAGEITLNIQYIPD